MEEEGVESEDIDWLRLKRRKMKLSAREGFDWSPGGKKKKREIHYCCSSIRRDRKKVAEERRLSRLHKGKKVNEHRELVIRKLR